MATQPINFIGIEQKAISAPVSLNRREPTRNERKAECRRLARAEEEDRLKGFGSPQSVTRQPAPGRAIDRTALRLLHLGEMAHRREQRRRPAGNAAVRIATEVSRIANAKALREYGKHTLAPRIGRQIGPGYRGVGSIWRAIARARIAKPQKRWPNFFSKVARQEFKANAA